MPLIEDTIFNCKEGGLIEINIPTYDEIIWSDNDTSHHRKLKSGKYKFKVTNSLGCYSFDSLNIVDCPVILDIPDAFTPNNDYSNDNFEVIGKGIKSFEMSVFNRWGELIFYDTNINSGWDGNYNGQPAPPDSYIYYIRALTIQGNLHIERKGSITLLR